MAFCSWERGAGSEELNATRTSNLPSSNSVKERGSHGALRSQLPIAQTIAILHKWGIHTLGELAALDKEELRARLGNEAGQLWERANGTANRLLKFVQPPESFEESFEFDHEIETAEPLLFMLRRFLEQLALRFSSIYLVARELTLRISFSNHDLYERVFKIPQPTNDVDLLFRMLQTHLENLKSEHPIIAVALSAQPIRPVSQQFGLFETTLRNPHQLYETLARLSALLGIDRVGTPVLEETHRPDAFRMELFTWQVGAIDPNRPDKSAADTAASTAQSPSSSPSPQNGEKRFAGETMPVRLGPAATAKSFDGHRPPLQEKPALRRFRPPARTAIFISKHRPASRPKDSHFAEVAGSPSSFYLAGYKQRVISFEGAACSTQVRRHLESEKVGGQIVDQAGPFLLSGNWWDEKAWTRAEWDMQLENSELIRANEADGKWAIDGIYD